MNKRIVKIVLLAVFTLTVGVASIVIASTESGHGGEAVVSAESAGHGVEEGQAEQGHSEEGQVAEHSSEGGHGEAHGGSFTPAKLKDLFWRVVNFAALLIILIKFLAKPIGNGLAARQQRVKEELDDLLAKRDEAERSYKQFESRLAGMEKEMENLVEKAIAQAKVEKERILEAAEKTADDIKRQAEATVQAEVVEAKKVLQNEVAEQAALLAEELIIKNLTPADQVAITEQYLDRVGAV